MTKYVGIPTIAQTDEGSCNFCTAPRGGIFAIGSTSPDRRMLVRMCATCVNVLRQLIEPNIRGSR